jgi:hypothetical protein
MKNVDIENIEMTGVGAETIGRDEGLIKTFRTNQLVVAELATGTATVRAKGRNSDVFEDVDGGVIDLTINRTITITSDSMIEEFEVTVSAGTPYKLSIFQSDQRRGGLEY